MYMENEKAYIQRMDYIYIYMDIILHYIDIVMIEVVALLHTHTIHLAI